MEAGVSDGYHDVEAVLARAMTRRRRLISSLPLPAKLLSLRFRLPSLLGLAHALPFRLARASFRIFKFLASLFLFRSSYPSSARSLTSLIPSLCMDDLLPSDDCLFDLDYGSSSRPFLGYFPDEDSHDSGREKVYLVPYGSVHQLHVHFSIFHVC